MGNALVTPERLRNIPGKKAGIQGQFESEDNYSCIARITALWSMVCLFIVRPPFSQQTRYNLV